MFEREQLIGKAGDYKTQSLFLETAGVTGKTDDVIMTLKEVPVDFEGKMLPSLRQMYMEDADPTGYTTAMRVFGSWDQWLRIQNNKIIKKYLDRYEAELDVLIRSKAVKAMIKTASYEGSKGTTAAKYIAEKGWDKRKAGAPSKEEKAREMKISQGIDSEIADDLERLGLH